MDELSLYQRIVSDSDFLHVPVEEYHSANFNLLPEVTLGEEIQREIRELSGFANLGETVVHGSVSDQQRQMTDLMRQLVKSQQELQDKLKSTEEKAKKALYLSAKYLSENKRLRTECDDSLEREKKLKVEKDLLDLKLTSVDDHISLFKNHLNSDGFTSPITGKSFSLGNKRYPLKCTNPICKGYISLKDYQDMEIKAYGAFCQSCRSELPGQPRIYSGFELDHKTAIMSSQAYHLDLIEKNKEPLKKLIGMKNAGFLEGIHSLAVSWKESASDNSVEQTLLPININIPIPVYFEGPQTLQTHPLLLSKPNLPSFVKLPEQKMTSEALNGLLNLNGSFFAYLKNQEAKVEGASIWSSNPYPCNPRYQMPRMTEEEIRAAHRTLRTDYLIHALNYAPEEAEDLLDTESAENGAHPDVILVE